MASIASCWRWARVRVSLSIWAWLGVPVVQGWSSAGLHMPGAAYLAKITSHTAHAWGVKFALAVVIASRPWAVVVKWRLRARSASSGTGPS